MAEIKTDETKRISIDIAPELHKQLKSVAVDKDTTIKELLTVAIETIIDEHKKSKG